MIALKLMSWNVNGLRACLGKGFTEAMAAQNPDILCLQEIKMEQGQAETGLEGYHEFYNSAEKKGYSGTLVLTKTAPLAVTNGIGIERHDKEGRVITAEFADFYLVNCYTPNAQRELARLAYRLEWESDFCAYLQALDKQKPVILCGDLNVAHQEIDLKNPRTNRKNAGFTDEERGEMTKLLAAGFADSFRILYPEEILYTWWSYMGTARARNVGWRIDYFVVSQRLMPQVQNAGAYNEIMGSDHCPVFLELDAKIV